MIKQKHFILFLMIYIILFFSFAGIRCTFGEHKHQRVSAAKTQIKNFGEVLKLYKMKKGFYPHTLDALTVVNEKGHSFIEAIPKDPWGNDYIYRKENKKFEIVSLGFDGKEGGEGESSDIKYSELHKKEQE